MIVIKSSPRKAKISKIEVKPEKKSNKISKQNFINWNVPLNWNLGKLYFQIKIHDHKKTPHSVTGFLFRQAAKGGSLFSGKFIQINYIH